MTSPDKPIRGTMTDIDPARTDDKLTLERCARAIAEVTADRLLQDGAIDKGSHRTFVDRRWQDFLEESSACIGAMLPEMPDDFVGMAATNAVRTYITAILKGEA